MPELVKAILGPDWHPESSPSQFVIPLSDEYAIQLLGFVIMVTRARSWLDQPTIDALRMPAILKFVVRLNSLGQIDGLQIKHLLENLLRLGSHKPEMILEPLVNCLTSIPWINSVTEIIDILLCTADLAWPDTGIWPADGCESTSDQPQCDHIDTWFRLLDVFIVNEAWPQLRPPLLKMRMKHLGQLDHIGYNVNQFYESTPDIEDGTGTEETEIHGDFNEDDVAGHFQDSDARGSQMHLDQSNHSPISAQQGADPLALHHSTNGADLTTGASQELLLTHYCLSSCLWVPGSPTVCLDGLDALMTLNQQPVCGQILVAMDCS